MFFTFIPWSRAFWGFGFKLVGEPVACTKPFLKPQNLNPKLYTPASLGSLG